MFLYLYFSGNIISQRARRTPIASPPLPTPPSYTGTFHHGPKMYLRVSRTQSHLFSGQPLGYTGVRALCAREGGGRRGGGGRGPGFLTKCIRTCYMIVCSAVSIPLVQNCLKGMFLYDYDDTDDDVDDDTEDGDE